MTTYTARTGLHWVKQGLQLFRKQPGGLMALFFCCMFVSMFIMIIPGGPLVMFVLTPLFSVALFEGCKHVYEGKRALPLLLLSGLRKPARGPLLGLGALNLGLLMIGAAVVYGISGDAVVRILEQKDKVDPALVKSVQLPMLIVSGAYNISWILTCFAAPLVYWQRITVGKALFFSVVSITRAFKAVFIASLALLLMYFVCANIVKLVLGISPMTMAVILSLSLLLVVVTHCIVYVAYRDMFDQPPQEAAPVDLDKHDTPDPMA